MAENERNGAVEPDKEKDAHHDTLKYSLLGPSLMKSGQDTVDQQKVIPCSILCIPTPWD